MAITGTIPNFDISTSRHEAQSLVVVTGAQADGQANGANSNENIQELFNRAVGILSISGVEAVNTVSATVGGQIITSGELSGIMNLQREFAMRQADVEFSGSPGNAARLKFAQDSLVAGGGEVQFGS